MKSKSLLIRTLVAASFFFTQVGAFAGTDIWTGGGANLFWLNTANWNPTQVPQPGDDLVFTNVISLINSNNISGSSFNSITAANHKHEHFGRDVVTQRLERFGGKLDAIAKHELDAAVEPMGNQLHRYF